MTMSVSKISGKLTFVMLLALALSGCVVASGPGGEGEEPGASEKLEQAGEPTQADKSDRADATENGFSVTSTAQVEPQPEPWVQGDPPPAQAAEKIPLKPHVEPSRTDPYPE
jgi:hypothetical protein